nr:MAG TPA: hypothetical protein [Caudoviricetes sp.]
MIIYSQGKQQNKNNRLIMERKKLQSRKLQIGNI